MELFKRRYLCFLAFVFLFTSVIAYNVSGLLKVILLTVICLLLLVAIICLCLFHKIRFALVITLLSLFLALIAMCHSLAFITLPVNKAMSLDERFSAQIEIISLEYSNDSSREYNVKLIQAGDEKANLKAYLVCDFAADFEYGDRIIAVVESEAVEMGNNRSIDKDILLILKIDASQPVLYDTPENVNIFSVDWLRSQTRSLRATFCNYIDDLFGENGALVKGMLINEKSDIQSFTKAQFRRAGVSHLLAVSGLHVSLLLGALELLLKRFLVPKKIRIAVAIVGGSALLALTDFSASAVRAVLMLFAIYLNYMLSEESDAPTSLFVAVALIVLISPFSVADIGMWLSFGATLGLVSVYPYLDMRLNKLAKGISRHKRLVRAGIGVLRALLVTLVANMFILPLMWYFFGDFSLVSLPCNLLISPLSALFLPLCVISLLLGKLGIIGTAVIFLTKTLGDLILNTVSIFADLRWATVSLRFPFVSVLVIAFTLAMAVLMVISLKRKLIICLPTVVLVASFSLCLCVFNLCSDTKLQYFGERDDEIIFAERAGKVSLCEMTDASSASYRLIFDNICDYSVEIENYILTSVSGSHPDMLERIYENTVIRNLYIPLDESQDALTYTERLYEISEKYKTRVVFYHSGDEIKLFDDLCLRSFSERRADDEQAVFLSFYNSSRILTYTDASQSKAACAIGSKSPYFLLGSHGKQSERKYVDEYNFFGTDIIASKRDAAVGFEGLKVYTPKSEKGKREFAITVE
ncbi:MAG: ComEC/Rec2 family competence protein [Clostridia bacterium]|nr:ComEC/Rec2 family competence protein [Clostridia bacterium]